MKQSKKDQIQGVQLAGNDIRTGSPPLDYASSQNQQNPPIIQCLPTPQPTIDQSPLICKAGIATLVPTPIVLSQWQQLPHQQVNPSNYQVQHGQPQLQVAQPNTPFWQQQQPGYHFPGANLPVAYQPLTPSLSRNDASSVVAGGGTSIRHQEQVPEFYYHVGYPYPGIPAGPWDPWWGQAQQSEPPCTYTFSGPFGYLSSPSLLTPGYSSAVPRQSVQRGIIRPSVKLSQKHQQLWEAQSAENVQLWTIIGHLQSEVAEYKNRIMTLEAEIKPKVEANIPQSTEICLQEKTPNRGRPKKSVASVDALTSRDESHPRVRGRKPAQCKAQFETRALNFERVVLKKVENKERTFHPPPTTENDKKVFTNSGSNMEIHDSDTKMRAFRNQVYPNISRVSLTEMKTNDDKAKDTKNVSSNLSQHVNGNQSKGASATYIGGTSDGNLVWPSNISSEDSAQNGLRFNSQAFCHNSNVIRQGQLFPGWSFKNGQIASGELEDAVIGSAKDGEDDDDAELENDINSCAEDENAYNLDAY